MLLSTASWAVNKYISGEISSGTSAQQHCNPIHIYTNSMQYRRQWNNTNPRLKSACSSVLHVWLLFVHLQQISYTISPLPRGVHIVANIIMYIVIESLGIDIVLSFLDIPTQWFSHSYSEPVKLKSESFYNESSDSHSSSFRKICIFPRSLTFSVYANKVI